MYPSRADDLGDDNNFGDIWSPFQRQMCRAFIRIIFSFFLIYVKHTICIPIFFQLRVWKIQEDIRTATDTRVDKVMEAVLEGLQTQTVYVLRMLGYSEGGDGKLSESVYFTVLGKHAYNV